MEEYLDWGNKFIKYRRYAHLESVFDIIKKYAVDKKLVLESETDSQIILISENPLEDITSIGKNIDKSNIHPGWQIEISAKIINLLYVLKFGPYECLKVRGYEKYKDISLVSILNPIQEKLLIIPPEIRLIDIYSKLSNPEYYSEWANLFNIQKILVADIKRPQKIIKPRPNQFDEQLRSEIWLYMKNRIILGGSNKTKERYSVITNQRCDAEFDLLKTMLSTEICMRSQPLHLINYPFMKKYTIYSNTTPILDFYTIASHELIPYINLKCGVKMAHFVVVMRFLLINIWILNVVKSLGQLDDKYYNIIRNWTLNRFLDVHEQYSKKPQKPKDFYGIYKDEDIARKKQINISRSRNPDIKLTTVIRESKIN